MNISFDIRNKKIPFKEGYKTVKLVGKTGAGKTSILRQLMGTDLGSERFPATSSGKTTVSTTEIILDNSNEYKLVATFFSEEIIKNYLLDCFSRVIYLYKYEKPTEEDSKKTDNWKKKINRCLYQDSTEKFKLSHLFGKFEETNTDDIDEDISASDQEKNHNLKKLMELKEKLFIFADTLEINSNITKTDFNDIIFSNKEFLSIIDFFMNEIRQKKEILNYFGAELNNENGVEYCTYYTYDRKKFIQLAKILTGNHIAYWGKGLAPLIEGIRISGNFRSKWWSKKEDSPKLILIDGLGLSHEVRNTDSISEEDKQFDKILYVSKANNAFVGEENYLKKFRLYGLTSKLHLAVTFFDEIKDDDIGGDDDKIDKIQASLNQALDAVSKELKDGGKSKEYLAKQLENKTFYLGEINKEIDTNNMEEYSEYRQLNELLDELLMNRTCIYENKYNEEVVLDYDKNIISEYMVFFEEYKNILLGKLGLDNDINFSINNYTGSLYSYNSVRWMVIYISDYSHDGSDYFNPAKSLEAILRANIYSFLYNEVEIDKSDDKEVFINDILNNFSEELYILLKQIIIYDNLDMWKQAKQTIGTGSSGEKAILIYKRLEASLKNNEDLIIDSTIKLIKSTIDSLFNQ